MLKQKNIFCRILAMILTILICMGFITLTAAAAPLASGELEDMEWSLSGGVLTVEGDSIPNFTEKNPAPWYSYRSEIYRLNLDSDIASIGNLAFYDCSALVGVNIPEDVETIGNMAFAGCSAMQSVYLSNVESIGEYAFSRCFAIKNIILPQSLKTIGYAAFYRCASLQSVTLPAGLESMGGSVFAYCESLLEVKILCPLEKLPEWTFYGCSRLQRVTLPSEMKESGDSAFARCDALTEVYHNGAEEDRNSLAEDIAEDVKTFTPAQITPSPEQPPLVSQKTFEENENGLSEIDTEITDSENTTIQTETIITRPIIGQAQLGKDEQAEIKISATVTNEDGWDELLEKLKDQSVKQGLLKEKTGKDVAFSAEIKILNDPVLYGKFLEALAGKNIMLYIRTPSGSNWSIDCSMLKGYTFKKSYNMEYTLTRYENPSKSHKNVLGSAVSYWLSFEDRFEFPTTVELYIDPTAARQVASLYEKPFLAELERLQSVTVGQDGVAPYRMANINSGRRYIVALNVSGISSDEVIIYNQTPNEDDWLENYVPITEQYKITEVRGFLGMTMKQFTWAVVGGIAVLALIIFIIALIVNMQGKRKALMERERLRKTINNEEQQTDNTESDTKE